MNKKLLKNLVPLTIAAAAVIITGVIIFINQSEDNKGGESELTKEQISEKALNYINTELLRERTSASLLELSEESGLVKLKIDVGNQVIDTYATKDGKLWFPQAFNLDESLGMDSGGQNPPSQEEIAQNCEEVEKSQEPVLEAFVVSKCPYGLQMQRILAEIVNNIPSLKENIKVRYIGDIVNGKITAMHGDTEAQENLRQICLREETDKYWEYISCHIKSGNVDNCLAEAGVNPSDVEACMTESSRGIAYAQEDFDLQDRYGATGSPTLILNGKRVSESPFGGRTAEAVKTLTCCGFSEELNVCSQKLDERRAASGFSEEYSSEDAPAGGGC